MTTSRRGFLVGLGAGAAALAAPAGARADVPAAAAPSAAAPAARQAPGAAEGDGDAAYAFFPRPEAELVEAAVARLIPEDDLGPGGVAAGVPWFLDRQLAGAYGAGARTYLQGPFGDSTPEQGYQLPLSPAQLYRTALADVDGFCRARHGAPFAALAGAAQDAVLRGLEDGTATLARVPARTFFEALLADVRQGFFADPLHGGNRGKVGWRLVGFPGVGANYTQLVEQHGRPYRVSPVDIADVLRGRVARDGHGHPVPPADPPSRE